jgi:sucrose-6-phosphate hydrolase SacC (GH32 family)
MPFNQQMTVPRTLALRTTPDGFRLHFAPVRELEALRGAEHRWQDLTLGAEPRVLEGIGGQLLEIAATLEPGSAEVVRLDLGGPTVEFSAREKRLTALGRSAPLRPVDGRIELRILRDRTSLEIFANGGIVQMASCFLPAGDPAPLTLAATGGEAVVRELRAWELRSIWGPSPAASAACPVSLYAN